MLKIGHALVISAGLLWLIHYDINMSFSKTEKNDINFEMQILQTEEQIQSRLCGNLKSVHYIYDISFLSSNVFSSFKSMNYSGGTGIFIYSWLLLHSLLLQTKYTDANGKYIASETVTVK